MSRFLIYKEGILEDTIENKIIAIENCIQNLETRIREHSCYRNGEPSLLPVLILILEDYKELSKKFKESIQC